MRKYTLALCFALSYILLLEGCASSGSPINGGLLNHQSASTRDDNPSSQFENPAFWQGDTNTIWDKLQHTSKTTLAAHQSESNSTIAGWIKLALISKNDSTNTNQLVQQLLTWRSQYPQHPANALFPADTTLNDLLKTTPPQHIALLLPLTGKYAASGNVVKDGFLNGYYQSLSQRVNQQNMAFYDTNSNPNIAALYQQAISKGADIIIGPLTKEQVKQLMGSTTFSVPTIALNYTDTSWISSLPNNLYQFGLSPLDEAKQIADKAARAGLSHAIIIAPKNEWGMHSVKTLTENWQADGGSISDVLYFSEKSNLSKDIAQLMHIDTKTDQDKTRDKENRASLAEQRRHDFDVIFLLASPQNARVIVPLLRFYYVDKTTPIYATSIIYSGSAQPQKDMDLNGVIFCDIPAVFSGGPSNRLFSVGRDAYLISQNIPRFSALPNFPVYASTGALTLTPQRQFYRRLAWAQIHGGQP